MFFPRPIFLRVECFAVKNTNRSVCRDSAVTTDYSTLKYIGLGQTTGTDIPLIKGHLRD